MLAKDLGATVLTMCEHPHLDRYSPPKGSPGETVEKKAGCNGHPWATGINHGRMETQVEMSWPINSLKEARAIKRMARKATQKLWENYGVSVI